MSLDIPDSVGVVRQRPAMNLNRLVITAVLTGPSRPEVAATYGVSQGWITGYGPLRAEGEAAFEPRSRAPKHQPDATPPAVVDLIVRLRKQLTEAGSGRRRGHHRLAPGPPPRRRRVAGHNPPHLARAGLVTPDPKKRPKSSYIRFEAEQPNETWQSDFTHYRLTRPRRPTGADTEILTWLDDHSRYALTSPPTPGSPARSCSPPSAKPLLSTASRPPP